MSSHLASVEGAINLGNGQPEESKLPHEIVASAASRLLMAPEQGGEAPASRWLQYGKERGDPGVLGALAAFLTEQYGFPVSEGELCMSSGVSHSLDLACGALLSPGDVVLVEDPAYFLAPPIFEQRGMRMVAVPSGPGGVDPAEVERLATKHGAKALYTVPASNNPRGFTIPDARRRELAAVAERCNLWIFADEVYQMLHFPTVKPATAMAAFSDRAVSCSSFSKILCPGVRVGWVHCRDAEAMRLIAGNAVLCSGGSTSSFAAGVVLVLMRDGTLLPYMERLRRMYEARHAALTSALRKFLPRAEWEPATGGYFVWVRLPGVDTVDLLEKCKSSVAYKTGTVCALGRNPATFPDCARLCFAHYSADDLVEGVRRLAEAVRAHFPGAAAAEED